MRPRLGTIALAVLGILALVAGARCAGRWDGARAAEAKEQRTTIDSLRRVVDRQRDSIVDLTAAARATDPARLAATVATEASERGTLRVIAAARAALDADSLTREQSLTMLAQLADSAERLVRLARAERLATRVSLEARDVVLTYVEQAAPAVAALTAAQDERIRTLEAGRPWWQRILGSSCDVGLVGSGAAVGSYVGGAVGAAAGGIVGRVAGVVSCP